MKALTVSSEGNRVLKVGTGGLESFALDDVLSCATTSDASMRTNQQQNAKRCMSSFPEINSLTCRSRVLPRAGLGGDGKAAAQAKGLRRNFQSRRSLLALVFSAIHHLKHPLHQRQIIAMIGRNLFGGVRIFDVFFKDCIEYLVRRQRIKVLLIG